MFLRYLFLIHAVLTVGAAVVLVLAPGLIPGSVGIALQPEAYLLSYFLAAAELGMAYLSFAARSLTDARALKIICLTFMIFHGTTALLEGYALLQGSSPKLAINVVVRLLAARLFYYQGVAKNRKQSSG